MKTWSSEFKLPSQNKKFSTWLTKQYINFHCILNTDKNPSVLTLPHMTNPFHEDNVQGEKSIELVPS